MQVKLRCIVVNLVVEMTKLRTAMVFAKPPINIDILCRFGRLPTLSVLYLGGMHTLLARVWSKTQRTCVCGHTRPVVW